jgi:hypothetical protein
MQLDHTAISGALNGSGSTPSRTRDQVRLRPIEPPALKPIAPAKPAVAQPAPSNKKRKKAWTWFRVTRWLTFLLIVIALGFGSWWGIQRARAALATYHAITADVHALQDLQSTNLSTFTAGDAAQVHGQFAQLQTDVDRMIALTTFSDRIDRQIARLPYVGPRYEAGTQTLQVVKLLADSGASGSAIGEQVLTAYKTNGLSDSVAPTSPTWLDVVNQNMPQITQITTQINEALVLRAQIDTRYLPLSAQTKLARFDELTGRYDLDKLVNTQLPALQAAFGADGPARYLVLIQNPSELRPSGGFPGTIALVTFDRGQLRNYEFFDVYDLNEAYTNSHHDPVAQPWPLSRYAPSPELSILDASWWSDFPKSAATIMSMYQSTGWPPIRGVVALDPAVVGSMLRITGPIAIDVDGETRTITADNVHDEIERQRALQRAGEKTEDVHKQVVAIIGKEIIERMKGGDRSTTMDMARAIEKTADHRDLQIYSADSDVQAIIQERGWAGNMTPEPGVSTLSLTFANVAFGKSSELMHPSYDMVIGPAINGMRDVQLRVTLDHTGSPQDDPFYQGFQRWWVDVTLPEGSQRIGSDIPEVANPEEPNGGSYEVPLPSGTHATFTIDYRMPDSSILLLRRQAGLTPAKVTIDTPQCPSAPRVETLSTDLVVSLANVCPAVTSK